MNTAFTVWTPFDVPGLKVGLLDADIYGPSVPLLMGVKGAPQLDAKSLMIPHVGHGVRCMSMGFLMKGGLPAEGSTCTSMRHCCFLPSFQLSVGRSFQQLFCGLCGRLIRLQTTRLPPGEDLW